MMSKIPEISEAFLAAADIEATTPITIGAGRPVGTIDLSKPLRSEGSGGRTVFTYACPACHRETRVRARCFRGLRRTDQGLVPIHAIPSGGAIACPHCRSDAAGREPGKDS
jgi:hypothetical protein